MGMETGMPQYTQLRHVQPQNNYKCTSFFGLDSCHLEMVCTVIGEDLLNVSIEDKNIEH